MRVIIAGSRTIDDYRLLCQAIVESQFRIDVILSGTANGVDRLGELWASRHNTPVEKYPANWQQFGKSAGYIRNVEMSHNADALIAIWDGKSRGTKNMIDIAKSKGLKVYVVSLGKQTA